MVNEELWCFAWFEGKPVGAGTTRAALQKNSKWKSGDSISVRFMSGDQRLKDRVTQVAQRWTAPGLANLRLVFNDALDADVRIEFIRGNGSWSTVGTTCRRVPNSKPTMNYGWISADSSEEKLRSVVLHEFGHALGLIHEHQNPRAGFEWNEDAVIAELSGPPNSWSEQQIRFNVLNAASPDDVTATVMDAKSIMMYPIPKSWTKDGRSTGFNPDLSPKDRDFIHAQYL